MPLCPWAATPCARPLVKASQWTYDEIDKSTDFRQ